MAGNGSGLTHAVTFSTPVHQDFPPLVKLTSEQVKETSAISSKSIVVSVLNILSSQVHQLSLLTIPCRVFLLMMLPNTILS